MLEYSKLILEKVSFDRFLFEKELLKCLNLLIMEEARELRVWCKNKFSKDFHTVVDTCFKKTARPSNSH